MSPRRPRRQRPQWDRASVKALRQHMGMTQAGLAQELGVRQQTVSEWETGVYQPRGASRTLLTLIAERAQFPYEALAPPEDRAILHPQNQGESPESPSGRGRSESSLGRAPGEPFLARKGSPSPSERTSTPPLTEGLT